MTVVTVRRTLPFPPQQVFDFVADMANDPHWAPMVSDVTQIEGDGPGEGARWAFQQAIGKRSKELESTMTVYDRPSRLAWSIEHRLLDYQATMAFEPVQGGAATRVVQTNRESWKAMPKWLQLLAPLLVRYQLKKQLRLLEKALAEGGPKTIEEKEGKREAQAPSA
ncbi:MAG: SRPBCC family protein [Thermoplasmatota archaeon]